jgi:hypothetical protein
MAVLHRDSRGALASQSQSPHHMQNLLQPLKRRDWLTCDVSLGLGTPILLWVVWHCETQLKQRRAATAVQMNARRKYIEW